MLQEMDSLFRPDAGAY